ncbi:hypothetical protein F5144DRAFT_492650 [Chaetomium tenue]|uniref:Uncharacterized protein n=1 Tax=Chaetomium tenue TaxID=1854479 RepID=A0ACB7P6R0_9PEZI|nr:hypothetical protein F5144DRAFT_492650 [Chaetomium globosum]
MPSPSEFSSQPRRRGLGDNSAKPPVKPGYCHDIHLTDDHPCAPSPPQIFSSTNAELWTHGWPATVHEHQDYFPEWEHPPQKHHQQSPQHQPQQQHPIPLKSHAGHAGHGTSHTELTKLSGREYALRASDPSDFASVWEHSILPLLSELIKQHCTGDFAVDVHNFPERSAEAVPRVIYITLPADMDTAVLEPAVRGELARAVPERFGPVYLKFRKGDLQRSQWCPEPIVGMSIGPAKGIDAASLGGFVRVGPNLYAMSARHVFEDAMKLGQLRVSHPADPDLQLVVPPVPTGGQYGIGRVSMCSPAGTYRPSLTFQGIPVPEGQKMVEMDCMEMNRRVAVNNTAMVKGNTEVYAMARTSGYSLGYTSDVPGVRRYKGQERRDWTVRQYSPFKLPKEGQASSPWQTVRQWVTSGIGVPGDSGAWLIQRSDDAVVGLIWGRNHDSGNPFERVRFAYFTPIVDILADVKQNHADGQDISLPVYRDQGLPRDGRYRNSRAPVTADMSRDPWNIFTTESIQEHRQAQVDFIESRFVGTDVPAMEPTFDRRPSPPTEAATDSTPGPGVIRGSAFTVDPPTPAPRSERGGSISTLRSQERLLLGLGAHSAPDLSLPELSTTSSIHSGPSMASDNPNAVTEGNGVRVVGELDAEEEIAEIEEPIRAKASFAPKFYQVSPGWEQI